MSFEPERIYLHDPHGYFEEDYQGDNTVTWSDGRISDNDYEYIRSPQNLPKADAHSLLAEVRAIGRENRIYKIKKEAKNES